MSASSRPHNAAEAPLPGGKIEPSPVQEWVGLLLPAATFFVHLQVGYVLVPWACTTRQDVWVHIVGALSVVLSLAGNLAAWRTWVSAGREEPGEGPGTGAHTRFLGAVGLGRGAIITLILIAQWIAVFFIGTCQ